MEYLPVYVYKSLRQIAFQILTLRNKTDWEKLKTTPPHQKTRVMQKRKLPMNEGHSLQKLRQKLPLSVSLNQEQPSLSGLLFLFPPGK